MATANTVSTLLSLGADAMSNMYDVVVSPPSSELNSGQIVQDLTYRIKEFNPPKPAPVTYDRTYKTVTIKRIATKIELERTFETTFTVDSNYANYKFIKAWIAKYMLAATGAITNEIGPDLFGSVEISALNSIVMRSDGNIPGNNTGQQDQSRLRWKYFEAYPIDCTEPQFSQGDATALEVTVTWTFGNFNDPQNGNEGSASNPEPGSVTV